MSQVDQRYCYNDSETIEHLEGECRVQFFSPHPDIHMVVFNACCFSEKMIHIANQAVSRYNLKPSQVVWLEHVSSQSASHSAFHQISFDWQTGQATTLVRSPIYEDWYLSWLDDTLNAGEFKPLI
jgi:hypothetical protein